MIGCRHVDNERIPPCAVYVPFKTVGEWHLYGVAGAGSYRNFIKQDLVPAGYPYTALSATGFGGVLLIGDVLGNFVAYDLACPVECRADVRIRVNQDNLTAECPVCHSVYDIVTNYGAPIGGPAVEDAYGLRRYFVGPGAQGEYMVISR